MEQSLAGKLKKEYGKGKRREGKGVGAGDDKALFQRYNISHQTFLLKRGPFLLLPVFLPPSVPHSAAWQPKVRRHHLAI